jgi:FMN phosphatase YigB (HAD superfamily)/carbamoylphosphate synthase large subunit
MPLTILLVAGGGVQGEALAHAIRAGMDARVIVADSVPDNLGRTFADLYRVSPRADDTEAFGDFLQRVVVDESVDVVLPCSHIGLLELAALHKRLRACGAWVAVSTTSLLQLLLDKAATYEALLKAGIPAQRPVQLTPNASLPLFGKPRGGWGGRDVLLLRTKEDLAAIDLASHAVSHCWVPWLETFEEFSVDAAIDSAGRISPLTLRRRVRTSGGFAVISDSVHDTNLQRVSEQTVEWLASQGGRGLFNIQLLRPPQGGVLVSDVNPRHGTSGGHASAEGNHLVAFLAGSHQPAHRRMVRTISSTHRSVVPIAPSPRWKGIVFDLDDTLLDHKRWIMERMVIAAASVRTTVPTEHFLRVSYECVEEARFEQLLDTVMERLGLTAERSTLMAAYRGARPAVAPMFPEVFDVLSILRRAGMRLGLLTDNPPESQRMKLQAMGDTTKLFDAVVFSRDHGQEKPAADGFRAIAEKLGLAPSDLLMVGDNVARDAVGAIDAGYDACLLVCRPGSRFQANSELLARYHPKVWERSWSAPDLRTLATACAVPIHA